MNVPISQILEEIVEVLQLTPRNLRLHGVKIIQVQSFHAPQSRLHASPMTVEHALGVPIFTDFQNAFECIRSHGPDSCCIMGVKGKVAGRLSQANLSFQSSGICAITSRNLGACT